MHAAQRILSANAVSGQHTGLRQGSDQGQTVCSISCLKELYRPYMPVGHALMKDVLVEAAKPSADGTCVHPGCYAVFCRIQQKVTTDGLVDIMQGIIPLQRTAKSAPVLQLEKAGALEQRWRIRRCMYAT